MPPNDGNVDPAAPTAITFIPASGMQMLLQTAQFQPTFMLQVSQAIQMPRMPYHPQLPQLTPLILQQQSVANTASEVGASMGRFFDDEQRLIKCLVEAEKSGTNYVRALEALDGVNGHPAQGWKDYYIINQKRLNEAVVNELFQSRGRTRVRSNTTRNRYSQGSPISISSESSLGRDDKSSVRRETLRSVSRHERQDVGRDEQGAPTASSGRKSTEQVPKKGRSAVRSVHFNNTESTISSATVDRQPSSTPPLREPTPPTRVERVHTGNRFTDEDIQYFVHFVQWKTEIQPGISRKEVCRLLEENAPHHSLASWQRFWRRQDNILDDMLAIPHTRANENEAARRDANLPEFTSIRTMDPRASAVDRVRRELLEEHQDDVERLGPANSSITEVELRVLARCEVLFPWWASLAYKERWAAFQAEYPERSVKAWQEIHRKNNQEIKRYIRLFQRGAPPLKDTSEAVNARNAAGTMQKRKANSSVAASRTEDDHLGKRPRVMAE
ncbi:hypothetical protein CERSUDRAFT_90754 [Gelatoporia subvermispora B]|uniref:Uncharacterized protein n=1 Tax=Ceriporiopsis subvermispora (strain B) TaxID=914234 RepID=M2QYC6_CERS8|nr:hypothetical protein CERSUDRAFT_90754 [Gelatoporia subvermispora B]